MRILGEIPHGFMKITVFTMNDKVSIKFEHDLMEHIIKFRKDGMVNDFETAQQFVNNNILEGVVKSLEISSHARGNRLANIHQKKTGEGFPIII